MGLFRGIGTGRLWGSLGVMVVLITSVRIILTWTKIINQSNEAAKNG